ncbi:hypothetical protein J7K41_02485, partial [Candidatus Micrarchaeota archaeon]|nr:hypothetical protein [Candidatus Micrarchaeota archaeon]
ENVLSEHEFRKLGVVEVRRTNTVHVPVERVSRDARRIARQMIEKNFVKYVSHAGAREVLSLFVNKGKGSFGLNLFARHYTETFAVRLGYHVYTDKVKLLTDASEAGIPYGIILHDFIAEALRTGCDVEDVVRWVIKTGDMHLIQLLCTEYELDGILYRELRNEGVSWDIIINVFFNSRKMDAMIIYLSNELGAMEPYLEKYSLPDYDPLFENPLFLNQLFSLKGTSAYEILFKMNTDKALALLVEGLRDNTVEDGEFWALLERVYRNRYAVLNALISEGYDDVIVSLIKKNESEYLVKMFFMYVLTAGKERAIDVYRDYGLIDPLLERMSPKLMKKMGPLAMDLVINSEDFVGWLYRFNNLFAPEEVYTCLKKRFSRIEALSMVDAVYGKGTALKIAEKEGPSLALKTAHLILTEDEFYDYVNRLGIEALMEYGDRRLRLDFIAKRMKESPNVSRTIKELRGIAPPGDLLSAFETNGGALEEFLKTAGIRVTLNALVDLERYSDVLKLLVKRYGKSKTARWAVGHLPLKEVLKNAADLGLERAVVDEFFRRVDMDDRQKIELLESVYGLGKTVNLMVATHRTLSVYDYLVEKFSSETAFTTMAGLLGEKRAMKEAVIAGYTSGAVSALIKKGYSASDCYALVYAVTGSVSRTWRILRSVLTEEEIVDGAWRIGHGIKLVRYLSRKHVLGMENTYELIKRVKGIKEAVYSVFEASKHNPAFRRLLVMREEEFVPTLAKKYGEKRAFGYLVRILGFENVVKTFARGLYGLRDSALSVSSVDNVTSSKRDTGSSRVPQPV